MESSRREIRAGILTYLACTFALSSIFYTLIIRAGHLAAGHGLYVLGLMWCPGTAAIVTCLIRRRPLASLGWKWKWRYQAAAYLIPILYAGAAYGVVWATGLGGFPNPAVLDSFSKIGHTHVSTTRALIVFVLATGTLGMISSTVSALGEEIGWRGFLVPELAKTTSFTKTALISGAIWTAWHVPILVFADARQRFAPDAIRRLVTHFRDPQVGAVSGQLILDCEDAEPLPSDTPSSSGCCREPQAGRRTIRLGADNGGRQASSVVVIHDPRADHRRLR